MNSTEAPSKRSQIETRVDYIIYFMFFLLFSYVLTGAVYTNVWITNTFPDMWYLGSLSWFAVNVQVGKEGMERRGLG